jgi:hypothetical protein
MSDRALYYCVIGMAFLALYAVASCDPHTAGWKL